MQGISNFIEHNTEIFNTHLIHWCLLIAIIMTLIFLNYNDKKKKAEKRIRSKYRKPVYLYFLGLVILIMLNISDSLVYDKYLLCFLAMLPFFLSIVCNFSTKIFLLFLFNLSFFCITRISPFLSIQANEVWVYLLLIFFIGVLLSYFSKKKVVLILFFLIIFNFFVVSFSCITHALDFVALPPYVEYLMYFSIVLLYIVTFLIYYLLTRVFYRVEFFMGCYHLEQADKVRMMLISLSLVMISLCLKYLYIYNVFVYAILDYFEIIILLNGTKNPHHDWMCGPGLKHLFGSHCRKMSSMLIYKQHQHDQMNTLYKEVKAIKIEMKADNIPESAVTEGVTTIVIQKTYINDIKSFFHNSRLRHYACLIEKNDGSKCVSHITHSQNAEGQKTLFVLKDPNDKRDTNIANTGYAVDAKYASEVLPNVANMQDHETRRLNDLLHKKPAQEIDAVVEKITSDNNVTISQKVEQEDVKLKENAEKIASIKNKIKKYKQNEGTGEVD